MLFKSWSVTFDGCFTHDLSSPIIKLTFIGRLIPMQPKYRWNAEASKKSAWFEKSTLARPRSIIPIVVALAFMPACALLAAYFG